MLSNFKANIVTKLSKQIFQVTKQAEFLQNCSSFEETSLIILKDNNHLLLGTYNMHFFFVECVPVEKNIYILLKLFYTWAEIRPSTLCVGRASIQSFVQDGAGETMFLEYNTFGNVYFSLKTTLAKSIGKEKKRDVYTLDR